MYTLPELWLNWHGRAVCCSSGLHESRISHLADKFVERCVSEILGCRCSYARQVEVTNGRWAMLGFLTAIIIEAGTGRGILLQLVGCAKALNLLGPASGV